MRLVDRQASLKNQYHFDCECYTCLDPHTDELFFKTFEGLVCFQCHNGISATLSDLDVNETVYCGLCRVRFRTLDYTRKLHKADKTFNKGKSSKSKLIKISNVII